MRAEMAAALLATTACAATVPHPVPQEPAHADEIAAARSDDERAARLEQALSELSAAGKAPDCRRACELVDQICDLSRRICSIAGRHRDDVDLADRCSASEQRCRGSRERLSAECACQAR
jgi:hypothetical protein